MVSQLFTVKAFTATLSLFSAVNAHMMMSSPAPYGKSTLDNSPLLADGSDFPCKQRSGVYDLEGASNNLVIGQSNTLSFIGSAVHGGGSCQVSLTTDAAPTKDSKWMVIHSIEGGCPSNVTGNLDADAAGTGAATFDYTIPDTISPGEYTIAWSWVNKIGNREFYMNCGPASISGASKKRYAPAPKVSKRQSTFPDMFVANLASVNDCTTVEGDDTEYPDPGSSLVKGTIGVNLQPAPACAAGSAGAAAAPTATAAAGSSETSAVSSAAASFAAGGASSAAGTATTATADNPGVFATGSAAASSAVMATSTAVVSPIPVAGTTTAAAAGSESTASSSTGTVTGAQTGACTDEGEWNCIDGSSFQRCASGQWSVVMEMATGTTCTPGMSDTFSMSGKRVRQLRRARRS